MKGFSETIENICAYTDAAFECYELKDFATITVEPVPSVGSMPKQLRNSEMLQAMHRHHREHIERIEKEKD